MDSILEDRGGERRSSKPGLLGQIGLGNLFVIGGMIGAIAVWHYRTEQLETKVQTFEIKYVPREVADQRFDHLLYRLNEIDKKLEQLAAQKRDRRP